MPRWDRFLKPDVRIWHYDAWILGPGGFKGLPHPTLIYSPVDHAPLPPPTKAALEGEAHNIAMTRFAEEEYRKAGLTTCAYIPHGYDPEIYRPGSQAEARRNLKLPEDAFIVSSIGTNKGPRKNLANLLVAFRHFLDREPSAWENAFLYLHCDVYRSRDNPSGYILPEIWGPLGIAERIKYVHSVYYNAYGFTEHEMADVLRASDWSILVSLGEGFGLPLIESLGCGTPVIFGNYSAMPEVVGPGGLPVDAIERIPYELSSSFQWMPQREQITDRLVEAYRDWRDGRKLRDRLGQEGHQHAVANYTWDQVMPGWLDLVNGISRPVPLGAETWPALDPAREGEVDLVIPTWQGLITGEGLLPKCVQSLYDNTSTPFHLIIVDDHSTDGTIEWCRKLHAERRNVTYVRPPTKCRGGAQILNIGYRAGRNPLVVTLNNDIIALPGWLERAVECIESDPRIGIVGFKMIYPDGAVQHAGGTIIKDCFPVHIGVGEARTSHTERRLAMWVSGPCCLVRRDCIGQGWDEDFDTFGGHEDVDACMTARSQGWKVVYCGDAEVIHLEGMTVTRFADFWAWHNRARQVFSDKWYGSRWVKRESLGQEGVG